MNPKIILEQEEAPIVLDAVYEVLRRLAEVPPSRAVAKPSRATRVLKKNMPEDQKKRLDFIVASILMQIAAEERQKKESQHAQYRKSVARIISDIAFAKVAAQTNASDKVGERILKSMRKRYAYIGGDTKQLEEEPAVRAARVVRSRKVNA